MNEENNKTIDEIIKEINSGEEYSASSITKNGWTFWKMTLSFTGFLNTDEGKRLYKPVIFKQGSVMRYKIRGSDIIAVLEARKKGDLVIDYNAK